MKTSRRPSPTRPGFFLTALAVAAGAALAHADLAFETETETARVIEHEREILTTNP